MNTPAIALDNVTVTYNRHPAVHHVSGALAHGSLTAIVGPNGAGKSTLLKAIMGELNPAEGHIHRHVVLRDYGYLPQAAEINRRFPISVMDTVTLGGWKRAGAFGLIGLRDRARALAALSAVGLEDFETRNIGSLSAGQFQRVLFARLLMQDASVIILDEPFTAIDARTTQDLVDIIIRWHHEGRTVAAVLHDHAQVRAHFPETLLIARELIGWGPTHAVMSPINLARAHTLAESWDDSAPVCEPSQ
jgi:zinc/manganese transport system ATP-binding protein